MTTDNAQLNNTVTVYVSTFDRDLVVGDVTPAARNEMIQRCSNVLTKQQSYCVWKLLDYALSDCYGYGVESCDFTTDNGKWNCSNGVYFSLTHCNNVVAVAVGNHAVGVDIQAVASFARRVNDDGFVERILTDAEQALLLDVAAERKMETLAVMWTQKESIFKMQGSGTFVPVSIDTTDAKFRPQVGDEGLVHSKIVSINGDSYALSVAACVPSKLKLAQVNI